MKKSNFVGLVVALGVISGCTVTTGNGVNKQEMSGSEFLNKLSRAVDGDKDAFARKPVASADKNPESVDRTGGSGSNSANC